MPSPLKAQIIQTATDFKPNMTVKKIDNQNIFLQNIPIGGVSNFTAEGRSQPEFEDRIDYSSFPRGDCLDEYKDWESWSNTRWAWEFLRRNPDYISFCKNFKTDTVNVKTRQRLAQKKFGLLEFKDYSEPFIVLPLGKPPRFATAKVRSYARVSDKQADERAIVSKIKIRRGEVLIRFDVTQTHTNRSLEGQIAAATRVLELREKQWLRLKKIAPESDQRYQFYLLPLLRLLDMHRSKMQISEESRLTNSKIYWMLFPFSFKEKELNKTPFPYEGGAFEKKFQSAKNKAISYTRIRGYLDLAAQQDELTAATGWVSLHVSK